MFDNVPSITVKGRTPCGTFYLVATVAFTPDVQLHLSGMDPCQRSWLAAVDTLINMATKTYSLQEVAQHLTGLKCDKEIPAAQNWGVGITSCADAIAKALQNADKQIKQELTN